jgi:hypothetical protein
MAKQMAKLSNKNSIGTSFHSITITCSVNDLIAILGKPEYSSNDGEDKVNFEWICETETGDVFTVYDYKEYRSISKTENIDWHIGASNKLIAIQAKIELNDMLYIAAGM